MRHEEVCGPNALTEIYRADNYGDGSAVDVVRWCHKCGAITVDSEHDGRTQPGSILPMAFPQVSRDKQELREALMGILEIGKRDMTNPKYDGYFEYAAEVTGRLK